MARFSLSPDDMPERGEAEVSETRSYGSAQKHGEDVAVADCPQKNVRFPQTLGRGARTQVHGAYPCHRGRNTDA